MERPGGDAAFRQFSVGRHTVMRRAGSVCLTPLRSMCAVNSRAIDRKCYIFAVLNPSSVTDTYLHL